MTVKWFAIGAAQAHTLMGTRSDPVVLSRVQRSSAAEVVTHSGTRATCARRHITTPTPRGTARYTPVADTLATTISRHAAHATTRELHDAAILTPTAGVGSTPSQRGQTEHGFTYWPPRCGNRGSSCLLTTNAGTLRVRLVDVKAR